MGDREEIAGRRYDLGQAAPVAETAARADPGEPSGLRPGEPLAVVADDYAQDRIVGVLVSSSTQHVAVRLENEQAGATVAHFPRAGYNVTRVA